MKDNKRAAVFTLGCKTNQYESFAVMRRLSDNGYDVSDKLDSGADLYVINTCAVTKEAERKSAQIIRRVRKLSPDCDIIVMGCSGQNSSERLSAIDGVKVVGGTRGKLRLIDEYLGLDTGSDGLNDCAMYEDNLDPMKMRTRSYIKVQDGCDCYCSYCIVPFLRGESRSRPMTSIVREIEGTESSEIVLGGINLCDYRHEGLGIADLLIRVGKLKPRIRLGSLHINAINRELLEAMKQGNYCPHFHLSIQSMSDSVLKGMNRRYTAREVINAADLIREYYPDAGLTSDIIAGFPNETDDAHSETLINLERADLMYIHIFPFSPREGTRAARLPDLVKEVKTARVKELEIVRERMHAKFLSSVKGRRYEVLTEQEERGMVTGYTPNYIKVFLPAGTPLDSCVTIEVGDRLDDGVKGIII